MATIQQRGNVYRVQVRRAGKKLSATFDTMREALDWATRTEADILSGRPVQTRRAFIDPAEFTGAAMLLRYSDEVSPLKRGARWEQLRLKKLARDYDVFQLPAVQISGPALARWRDARLKEVSASTVNRERCLISSVFSKAMREWEVGINSNPVAAIEKPRKPQAALGQQVLHIPQAQGEPHLHDHYRADDLGRGVEVAERAGWLLGSGHRTDLLSNHFHPVHLL